MRRGGFFLALLSALGLFLGLGLTLLFIPASVSQPVTADPELGSRFYQEAHNRLQGALDGYTYVRKHYRIPAGSLPDQPAARDFGESADPQEILGVIRRASELLGDDAVMGWQPDTRLYPGTKVRYYYDETILVLVWQEEWNSRICTWCEVKLSDPSQLRRKLSGDSYGWPIQATATELAAQDRAVAAVSGDFYAFRNCGVHVYQGELRNVTPNTADTLFVTAGGDMLLSRAGELNSWGAAARYVKDNDIAFSLAFGPILVEDGRNVTPEGYRWGEIWQEYARAAISQVGELHYLFLAGNVGPNSMRRLIARDAAELMLQHGCTMAYALDGGQTAEVILGGELCNTPEFGYERQVSDVLCFASALPAEERP